MISSVSIVLLVKKKSNLPDNGTVPGRSHHYEKNISHSYSSSNHNNLGGTAALAAGSGQNATDRSVPASSGYSCSTVRTTAIALRMRTATVSATTTVLLQGRMLRMRNRILRAAAPPLPAAITWSETTVPATDITPAPVLLTDRQPPFCRKNRQRKITILRIGKRRHAK